MKGIFIVLEGPDGSGTTSHSKKLAESLRAAGRDVLLTCEATDGPIGTFTRAQLHTGGLAGDVMQLLFTADRAWHVREVLLPALEAGKTIVCDRYSLSTVLYGTAQGYDRQWLFDMNKLFVQPDILLLALPPFSTCCERLNRREKDTFEANDSLQKRVYDLYAKEKRKMPPENVFDTSGDPAETAARLLTHVQSLLPS